MPACVSRWPHRVNNLLIAENTLMADIAVIRCRENGPLMIQGPIQIIDHLGNAFPLPAGKDTFALCRCGQSKNRPFCDGSHKSCGFTGAETAPVATPAP